MSASSVREDAEQRVGTPQASSWGACWGCGLGFASQQASPGAGAASAWMGFIQARFALET